MLQDGFQSSTVDFLLANELGIAFKHVPVMQLYRLSPEAAKTTLHTKSPEFLKVNPNGHIPAIDDDGLVLNESLAINLYLAKKHGGPLAPANLAEDGLIGMWALWAAIEVEPHSIQVLYHRLGNKPEERDPKIAAAAIEALRAPFAVLDKQNATAELRFDHLLTPVFSGAAAQDGDELGKAVGEFVELKPGVPYRFTFELRHLNGGDAQLRVQGETLPKDRLSQLTLYAEAVVTRSIRAHVLLAKALQWLQALGLNERELRYLLAHAADFDGV